MEWRSTSKSSMCVWGTWIVHDVLGCLWLSHEFIWRWRSNFDWPIPCVVCSGAALPPTMSARWAYFKDYLLCKTMAPQMITTADFLTEIEVFGEVPENVEISEVLGVEVVVVVGILMMVTVVVGVLEVTTAGLRVLEAVGMIG